MLSGNQTKNPIALQCTSIYVLCLLSSHHQMWHMISLITKVLLEVSGGGIGFFAVHFSMMIGKGIQIQDSQFIYLGDKAVPTSKSPEG